MVAYNYKYKLCNLKIMVAHNHIACYNVKKGEGNMYSGKICPKCGKSTTENDAFCPFCGKKLTAGKSNGKRKKILIAVLSVLTVLIVTIVLVVFLQILSARKKSKKLNWEKPRQNI